MPRPDVPDPPRAPLVAPKPAAPRPRRGEPATGRELGLRLARALRLDPERITAMTLRLNTTDFATLEVETQVPADPIETVLKLYDLVERAAPGPTPVEPAPVEPVQSAPVEP